jgi:hypothetical protein
MSVATAEKIKLLSETIDFKATVFKEVGDLSKDRVMGNRILVAIFFRPNKIRGVWRPDSNVEEDAYQSKIGLVLQKGAHAFVPDVETDFRGDDVQVGQYILYRASDGFPETRNGVPCRILKDQQVMMIVNNPEEWF